MGIWGSLNGTDIRERCFHPRELKVFTNFCLVEYHHSDVRKPLMLNLYDN